MLIVHSDQYRSSKDYLGQHGFLYTHTLAAVSIIEELVGILDLVKYMHEHFKNFVWDILYINGYI